MAASKKVVKKAVTKKSQAPKAPVKAKRVVPAKRKVAAHDDGAISTLCATIAKTFDLPVESVKLVLPTGGRARSDVARLRLVWAKHLEKQKSRKARAKVRARDKAKAAG